jgi:hypothetical protein
VSFVALLKGLSKTQLTNDQNTIFKLYKDAVVKWATPAGVTWKPRIAEASALDFLDKQVSVTTVVATDSHSNARAVLNAMQAPGRGETGLTNTFKDLNPGLDSLQSVVVTFTKDPVNGYIKPVSSALYVLSSVTLIGIDKAHFSENEKECFQSVIAAAAGAVCAHPGNTCRASDVDILSVEGQARRETGVKVTFILTAKSAQDAANAAATLDDYMVKQQFATDLKNEGGGLATVRGTKIKTYPKTSSAAPEPVINAPTDKKKKKDSGGVDAGLIVGLLVAVVALLAIVAGIIVYVKRDKSTLSGTDAEQERAIPHFTIPTAEVVGVTGSEWSAVSGEEQSMEMTTPPTYKEDQQDEIESKYGDRL